MIEIFAAEVASGNGTKASPAPVSELSKPDSTLWKAVNAALASEDVQLIVSCQTPGHKLVLHRQDIGPHRLEVLGDELLYASSVWKRPAYPIRSLVDGISSGNFGAAKAPRHRCSIRGFRSLPTSGVQPLAMGNLQGVAVENCELTAVLAHVGPGLLLDPSGTQSIDGGNSHNVTLRRIWTHHNKGEGQYINGTKEDPDIGGARATGSDLLIEDCLTEWVGSSGEGDGLDIKDGWSRVTVRNSAYRWIHPANLVHAGGAGTHTGMLLGNEALISGCWFEGFKLGAKLGAYSPGYWGRTYCVIRDTAFVGCGGIGFGSEVGGLEIATPKVISGTHKGTAGKVLLDESPAHGWKVGLYGPVAGYHVQNLITGQSGLIRSVIRSKAEFLTDIDWSPGDAYRLLPDYWRDVKIIGCAFSRIAAAGHFLSGFGINVEEQVGQILIAHNIFHACDNVAINVPAAYNVTHMGNRFYVSDLDTPLVKEGKNVWTGRTIHEWEPTAQVILGEPDLSEYERRIPDLRATAGFHS